MGSVAKIEKQPFGHLISICFSSIHSEHFCREINFCNIAKRVACRAGKTEVGTAAGAAAQKAIKCAAEPFSRKDGFTDRRIYRVSSAQRRDPCTIF
jgi:hypothetical protein